MKVLLFLLMANYLDIHYFPLKSNQSNFNGDVFIGGMPTSLEYGFLGNIAQLLVYNGKALSFFDVQTLYNRTKSRFGIS